MTTPDERPLAKALTFYERWTRLLARAAALTLALAVLLPRLWRDASGSVRLLWPWDGRPHGPEEWTGSVEWLWVGDGFSPALALLLVVSLVAWTSSGLLPLARRGRWLLVPTAVCLVLSAGLWNLPGGASLHWARDIGWLPLAGLGLVFSGMPRYHRLGVTLSIVGGVLVLGMVLWPVGDWEWPILRLVFSRQSTGLADHLTQAVIVLALVEGSLLLWAGLSGETSRFVRRLTIAALAAIVGASLAANIMGPYQQAGTADEVQAFIRAWNLLRVAFRPYAEVLLVAVGVFAWIVGARTDPDMGAVFD